MWGTVMVMKHLKSYIILLICATVVCCLLLFLSGLLPQERIRMHLEASLYQLEHDEDYPNPIDLKRWSDYRDTYSEDLMLLHSYYTDTKENPKSILSNPVYSNSYIPMIPKMKQVFASQILPNPSDYYVNYWMGFRAPLRLLLTFLTYPQTLRFLTITVLLLFSLSIIKLYHYTGGVQIPILFTISFLLMNPIVLCSSFHSGLCFIVAFVGILLLPKDELHSLRTFPKHFFLIGILTQYLDFYTAPLVTFGLPIVSLLLINYYQKNNYRTTRQQIKLVTKCFLGWVSGYVLIWIIKLGLTTLFTDINAFDIGFTKFFAWTGTSRRGIEIGIKWGYERNPLRALSRVFAKLLLDNLYVTVLALVGITMIWFFRLIIVSRQDLSIMNRILKGLPYLVVAFIPLIWYSVTSAATIVHARYQYRMLAVFVYGYGAFICETLSTQPSQKELN